MNKKSLVFLKSEIHGAFIDRFQRVLSQVPDHLAVKSEGYAWTYKELDENSSQIAQAILENLGPGTEPIVLIFELGAPGIAAVMGVLRAGKFYTSLDQTYPLAYLAGILDQVDPRMIITDDANFELAKKLAPPDCVIVLFESTQSLSGKHTLVNISPDVSLGIFFTSGSTGKPKGVIRSQRAAIQRVWLDREDCPIEIEDRQTLLTSLCFTASSLNILNALLNGCTLCIFDLHNHNTDDFANWLNKEVISILQPPIAYFRHFLNQLEDGEQFPSVRCVSLGGDVLFRKDIENARSHFSKNCIYIHRLASSEVSIITCYKITSDTQLTEPIIPVGFPVPSREVQILDQAGNSVPDGQMGQITIRSRYLSPGYWKLPEENARRFQNDPFDPEFRTFLSGDMGRMRSDGMLDFIGRQDFMVKVRGYRVDISEVEAALMESNSISDAVVVIKETTPGYAGTKSTQAQVNSKSLVAYLVPKETFHGDAASIRKACAQQLPEYMLPSHYIFLDTLPRLPNGKVDRHTLSDPSYFESRSNTDQTSSPENINGWTAGVIASIASDVLEVKLLSEDDDFFVHGCNSLLAAQIVRQINLVFNVDLPLRVFYENPTTNQLVVWFQTKNLDTTAVNNNKQIDNTLDSNLIDYLRQFG